MVVQLGALLSTPRDSLQSGLFLYGKAIRILNLNLFAFGDRRASMQVKWVAQLLTSLDLTSLGDLRLQWSVPLNSEHSELFASKWGCRQLEKLVPNGLWLTWKSNSDSVAVLVDSLGSTKLWRPNDEPYLEDHSDELIQQRLLESPGLKSVTLNGIPFVKRDI